MCPYVVVGDRGTIRVSDDLGETWHAPTSPATAAALRGLVAHCPFRIGIAVGDDGTVLVASGDLETWRARVSGTDQRLQAVALARPVAVAVGDGGTIVRSGDEGETWAPVPVDTTADLRTVALTSSGGGPAMGMIGAADGALLVSRDDGETWDRINPGFTPPIRQIHVGGYEVDGATLLSATILAEGGLWAWHEAEGGLTRTHWLDLPAYAFTHASAPGGPSALTVLVDGAAVVYRYCMGCD
ncbi:WD40/YVTN/BNR-like repeat-containing protein [Nannocystis bainbridge]|uniref:Photosynthesis system II assembly factor Ycf48/Hcf136-like domain-containing protein n=1 Tax=Nannocystis bainbridge TaxID=2995303 RepID=A0ABT5DTM9_9BACT|nr:hypothetical protein [Nannocystis bainbridge]MDC0716510.1 hypothetical protein [Nannocystis bainbridge]